MKLVFRCLIILLCLSFCTSIVVAQGAGGFTANLDAGYSNTGAYTTQNTFTGGSNSFAVCGCGSEQIPDWYMQQAGICDELFQSTCDEDTDGDGCSNYEEYINYLNYSNQQEPQYPDCFCNDDGYCDFNFGERYPICGDCEGGCVGSDPETCEPEAGEWFIDGFDAEDGACDACDNYPFQLKSDYVGEIPEFGSSGVFILL